MIRRNIHDALLRRLQEPRRFLQVLAGPRQTGKTTLARQVIEAAKLPTHYGSADEPTLRDRTWLEQQWDLGRLRARQHPRGALLVLDEIQKVTGWSDSVKLRWDADTHARCPLKVVLLGSSPLFIQRGLSESLAGRFEIIPVPHWSFAEMREAFGWTLEQYLRLLQGAGMVAGLPKYAHGRVRQRGSSPKLQVMNTALMTAQLGQSFDDVRQDGDLWGRLVESAAGAHLLNTSLGGSLEVTQGAPAQRVGADGGGRTHTLFRVPDFESGASANSATSAQRRAS